MHAYLRRTTQWLKAWLSLCFSRQWLDLLANSLNGYTAVGHHKLFNLNTNDIIISEKNISAPSAYLSMLYLE